MGILEDFLKANPSIGENEFFTNEQLDSLEGGGDCKKCNQVICQRKRGDDTDVSGSDNCVKANRIHSYYFKKAYSERKRSYSAVKEHIFLKLKDIQ